MARAAWGFAAVSLLITGAVMMQNVSLKADNSELTERLSDAEEELAALARLASRGNDRRHEPARRLPDRDEPTPEDLLAEIPSEELLTAPGVEHQIQAVVEEKVKEEIGNRRAEWMERRRAELGESIAEYADEVELSEDTREELIAVMEDGMEDAANILRSRRENHSTSEQAREHMAELRETVYSDLADLLGEDEATTFLETVHGPLKSPVEP